MDAQLSVARWREASAVVGGRGAALAGDGDLELVSEHTTDFVGGKSQDTATATATAYAGTDFGKF